MSGNLKAFEIARYGDLRLSNTVAEDADKIVVGLADVWVEIEKSGSDSFTVVARTSEDDEHGHDGVVMFTMNNTTKEISVDAGARHLVMVGAK